MGDRVPSGAVMEFNPFSDDFFDHPDEIYRWMRDEAPVYHSERWDFYALSRFKDVVAAHRDWETFSSAYGVTFDALQLRQRVDLRMMIIMDPPEHDRLRSLVRTVFTRAAIAHMEPLVEEVINEILDGLKGRDAFDMVGDFAALFPVEIISAMLGVPPGERQQIRLWTDGMLHRERDNPMITHEGLLASGSLFEYILDLVRFKRRHPDEMLMSRLIDASYEDDDGVVHRLTDEDIASFVVLIAAAGSETETKLIGNGIVDFAKNPDQWAKVLADPTVIPGAVEEILRLHPPSQYQGRFATKDVELEGGVIPANSPVLLVTGAATRDPRTYERPDEFEISRGGVTTVAFGYGSHSCLGAWLARLESKVAFEEIRTRYPRLEVDLDNLRRVTMSNVAGYSSVPVHVR
jgi:cytochrome P450